MSDAIWVDSHCHPQLYENAEEVVQTSLQTGVKHMMCVATGLADYVKLKELKKQFGSAISISLGEHPIDGEENGHADCVYDEQHWHQFAEIIRNDKDVIAIGEAGFDCHGDVAAQRAGFDRQADIAVQHGLPLILHTREAEDETKAALKSWSKLTGVFHCFTGSLALADFALEQGWKISFSGIVTFKNAADLREVALHLKKNNALNELMIETDAPFLAPQKMRGQKNYPYYVRYIGEFLSELLEISNEEFAIMTAKNFFDTFKARE